MFQPSAKDSLTAMEADTWNSGRGRSSNSQMFFKVGVLKNFVIFTGKQTVLESLLKTESNTDVFL